MYFRLNSLTFLNVGKNYTIYDMKNNRIFILDDNVGKLLKWLELNNSIEDFPKHDEKAIEVLNKIQSFGIGDFYDSKVHIEKFRYSIPAKFKGMLESVPHYVKVYLEITNNCNLNCTFCGNSKLKNWLGCQSCFINYRHLKSKINYPNLIKELEEINLKELIIRSGDPFLELDILKEIVGECKKNNQIDITITTNGTENADMIIGLMKEYSRLKINVVVFSTYKFNIEKQNADIAKEELQRELFKRLKEEELPFSITVQVTEENIKYVQEVIDDLKQEWGKNPLVSELIDFEKDRCLPHIDENNKVISEYRNTREFYLRQEYNTCLYGVFSIDLFGNVKPCPGIEMVIGNLQDNSLREVLGRDTLFDYWKYTKDKVSNCKDCAMKYFCSDCSIFEIEASKNAALHRYYCPVNVTNEKIDLFELNLKNRNGNFIELKY